MSQFSTIGLASLMALAGISGSLSASAATKAMVIEDVETLNDNIAKYNNKTVRVKGEVKDKIDPKAVTIESGGIFNDEIVVVAGKNMKGDLASLKDDANVEVTGTIRTVPVVEIRRELSWDLNPELVAEFEGVDVFLVADEIKPVKQ